METKFCDYLRERCFSCLLGEEPLPDHGLPFRPPGWLAIAANRDNQPLRLPKATWRVLIEVLEAGRIDRKAYGLSSQPVRGAVYPREEQPFVIPLTMVDVEAHFGDGILNWSSEIVVGASERWVIWGNPEYTVLGGEPSIMHSVIEALGGAERVIEESRKDFAEVALSEGCLSRLLRGRN